MSKRTNKPQIDITAALPTVKCEKISKSGKAVNIYLTRDQAIRIARDLLIKATAEPERDELGIRIWNANTDRLRVTPYKVPRKAADKCTD
jgi:hypothetical protein